MLTYSSYYSQGGLTPPTGSRSLPRIMNGAACPETVEIGLVHGTAPGIATVTFDQLIVPQLGAIQTIQIGNSAMYGVCISWNSDCNTTSGFTTQMNFEDARTRLHDNHVYMQVNMLDGEGRWYHIFPSDWSHQLKTFISELSRDRIKIPPQDRDLSAGLCGGEAVSTIAIIRYLANAANFTWSADDRAFVILSSTFPDNVDWNSGVKVIEALSTLLSRFGLQMTFWGDLHCYITLKGYTSSVFANILSQGGATAICQIPNAERGSIGVEINDRGRKAVIIGGRNKYQAMYACVPDWNEKWTLSMAISREMGQALLKKFNVTELDKVMELPPEWQDRTIINNVTRNDMTIKDYLDTIVGKVYRVDFSFETDSRGFGVTEQFFGQSGFNNNRDNAFNSYYPPSDTLVDDSERNCYVYGTNRDHHIKGTFPSIFVAKWPDEDGRVVLEDGAMDVQESYNEGTCVSEYIVRVTFSDLRYTRLGDIKPNSPDLGLIPERPVICLSLDKEFYIYKKNEGDNSLRVREIKKGVPYLRQGFIMQATPPLLTEDYVEQPILQRDFIDEGMAHTVKASEIAPIIADQIVVQEATKTAGSIQFYAVAGFRPDGIIDSVKVTLNSQTQITETINFTTGYLDFEVLPLVSEYKPLARFETEKDVADRELRMRTRAMIWGEKAKAFVRGLFVKMFGDKKIAMAEDRVGMSMAVGSLGHIEVTVPEAQWKSKDIEAGDVRIIS